MRKYEGVAGKISIFATQIVSVVLDKIVVYFDQRLEGLLPQTPK